MGTLIIYTFGLPYMYYILNIMLHNNFSIIKILQSGMFAFIPGDVFKAVVAVLIAKRLKAAAG